MAVGMNRKRVSPEPPPGSPVGYVGKEESQSLVVLKDPPSAPSRRCSARRP